MTENDEGEVVNENGDVFIQGNVDGDVIIERAADVFIEEDAVAGDVRIESAEDVFEDR
jgi:hypothetical protein